MADDPNLSIDVDDLNLDTESDTDGDAQLEAVKKEKKSTNPLEELTEKNKQLLARSKRRYARDLLDAQNRIQYRFVPDPHLRPPPRFSGTVECIKVHCPKSKSFVAAVLYRVNTGNRRTILYSHGNATDIGGSNLMQCLLARGLGVNVLMYDYSGYGVSGGMPREHNTYHNVDAVYAYAVEHVAGGVPENIVMYGQSIGSGPSTYLAARKPVGGLILHSPFMSCMRVITPSRALGCLDIFPNIERIKKVKSPVFILHGMQDEEVDISHGMNLFEAVKEELRYEPWWIPDRGHNDICEGAGKMAEYTRRLKGFLLSLDDEDAYDGYLSKVKKMKR